MTRSASIVPESSVELIQEESYMKDKTIAVDLAKSVFEIGISGEPGHVEQCHRLSRSKLLEFFAVQEPAMVVMEACGSAHHWGRQFQKCGHKVKLLPPAYVRPLCATQ